MKEDSGFIEELRKNKNLKHVAIDGLGQAGAKVIDLENLPFFKIPAALYQKFDVVWHDKKSFGKHLNWRVMLDEMIRLIGREGRLVIAVEVGNESAVCYDYQAMMADIKMRLFRRIGLGCEVEFESHKLYQMHSKFKKLASGEKIVTVFRVVRTNIDIYRDKSWSFAMITGGDKVESVVKFCKSIRDLDKNFEHEILILGPNNSLYDQYKVTYIDHLRYRNEYAEICKKKNDIADFASNQNLLIAHDRFYLADNFFSGFEEYGYDFDFLAPIIKDENGVEEICWMLLRKNLFDHHVLRFGDFFNAHGSMSVSDPEIGKKFDLSYSFLSGGCLIFKRDILRKIRFNELIFWHQIEDWEMAAQFLAHGFVAKSNKFSAVINSRAVGAVDRMDFYKSKTFMRRIRRSLAKRIFLLARRLYLN